MDYYRLGLEAGRKAFRDNELHISAEWPIERYAMVTARHHPVAGRRAVSRVVFADGFLDGAADAARAEISKSLYARS